MTFLEAHPARSGTVHSLPVRGRPWAVTCTPGDATVNITLCDTTLRDGTQHEGISLSADDKAKIARRLHRLGIRYRVRRKK